MAAAAEKPTLSLDYSAVMSITLSWDKVRGLKDYEQEAGRLVYMTMFEKDPSLRGIFDFYYDSSNDVSKCPEFQRQASRFFSMIDLAVSFLGPDLEPLYEDMVDCGKRHKQYGVDPASLDVMKESIIVAMQKLLKDGFTPEDEEGWSKVLQFMVDAMKEGMK